MFVRFTADGFGLEWAGRPGPVTRAAFTEAAGVREMEYRPAGATAPVRAAWYVQGDTLTLCEGRPGDPRPTQFSVPRGSRRLLWVLKRADE